MVKDVKSHLFSYPAAEDSDRFPRGGGSGRSEVEVSLRDYLVYPWYPHVGRPRVANWTTLTQRSMNIENKTLIILK